MIAPEPHDSRAAYAKLAEDPTRVYRKKTLAVQSAQGVYLLDTSRFGRRFIACGAMIYHRRIALAYEQTAVADAAGVDKSLLSSLEANQHGKLRLSFKHIANLALILSIEVGPTEAYTAYVAEVYPLSRALYYPDDPGPLGSKLGLPLPGSSTRIAEREAHP